MDKQDENFIKFADTICDKEVSIELNINPASKTPDRYGSPEEYPWIVQFPGLRRICYKTRCLRKHNCLEYTRITHLTAGKPLPVLKFYAPGAEKPAVLCKPAFLVAIRKIEGVALEEIFGSDMREWPLVYSIGNYIRKILNKQKKTQPRFLVKMVYELLTNIEFKESNKEEIFKEIARLAAGHYRMYTREKKKREDNCSLHGIAPWRGNSPYPRRALNRGNVRVRDGHG